MGYKIEAFEISFWRSVDIFLWWIKTWAKVMSKQKQVQGSLYSFFGGKQSSDDKEINLASETPAPTKKTRKFQEAWKDKYKMKRLRFDGKEIKCSASFVENSWKGNNAILQRIWTKILENNMSDQQFCWWTSKFLSYWSCGRPAPKVNFEPCSKVKPGY